MRQLDDHALEQVARYFGALSVPMRLKILNALRGGERNVSELTAAAGCTQANASKHLALLTQHGLVERTARGTSVYYRIADPATYRLCDVVCGQIGKRFARHASLGDMFSAAAAAPPLRKRPRRPPRVRGT
ncbi:MAG: ArsR/SmtB family transcription factor [Burkholderiales bacterium]